MPSKMTDSLRRELSKIIGDRIDKEILEDIKRDAFVNRPGKSIGNLEGIKNLHLGGGIVSPTIDWLQTHADEFLLYVEHQGAITMQIPCQDLWNLCDHSRPHKTYQDAYAFSQANDARFHDKVKGLLSRYSGGLVPFYQYERHKTVDMTVYNNKEVKEETKTMAESTTAGKLATNALSKAFRRSVVNQAADVMLDAAKEVFGHELIEQVLSHEMGREILKYGVAFAYQYAAKNTEMIPDNETLEEICSIIMEKSAENVFEPNMEAFTKQVPSMIKKLTLLGEQMKNPEKMMSFAGFEAAAEEEKVEERVEEKVEVAAPAHFRDRG